ncbi:GAF domain-containing protein [Waterburya agarophytonicola K14]|uniref:histidine kinase n=1 Tax=Waterburya agarophytonicola KI4 TaxID=2874699 RepID=A0A964FES4_9CYAN|nr:ATP-binding protein [Waterburya agarophytonicola]MCC0176217.1 GAF domain-containing protein [Waterburya agarophytonicola KI4]
MSSDSTSQEILAAITNINLKTVDLNNCDREPIHIPNLIQPHGVLLVVSPNEYTILQVSLNTSQILGIEPQELLNQPLKELLGEEKVTAIKHCLSQDFDQINPLKIKLIQGKSNKTFDGIVHHNGNAIILELETRETNTRVNFFDFYKLVKNPVNKIHQASTIEQLCDLIAREIKAITGFDRVMVYRFDREGAGQVIAEAANPELEPFLGLHYPDTDIPKQAKLLYTLNHLRLIPDVTYEPVGLTPQFNPLTDKPLNMSMSALRSVSPLHTEYLNNMRVGASMSVSLVKNKQLWGLIACHHQTPKKVPYEIRTVSEFIGQVVSVDLAAKENNQDSDYKIKLKSIQSQFVAHISQAEDLKAALSENPDYLLDLVGASGVALSFGDNITLFGNTPDEAEIREMLPWLTTQFDDEVIYETNNLAQTYVSALAYGETASGLLALLISRVEKSLIIWFRPEVMQTVNWAGNPQKIVEIASDGNIRMFPRKSFAKWQETVKLKSLPWKACEVEAALELRSSIVGIVLRKADELAQVNQELSRSNVELDAFAYIASHDLKEPLRGIYNYSSFLIEDYGEVLDESGKDKLNTLMRLTHRMEDLINSLLHYSRLGRAELQVHPTDLNDLIAGVLDVIEISARDTQVEFQIPPSLPTIKCDRTQINELFTNLISNGIKYNQKSQKIIEIGYLDREDPVLAEKMLGRTDNILSKTVFYVRDNGIGIRARHLESIFRIFKRLHGQKKYGGGTGAGLTIAKKIVERHGGEIWVESVYTEGTTFYFTLE